VLDGDISAQLCESSSVMLPWRCPWGKVLIKIV